MSFSIFDRAEDYYCIKLNRSYSSVTFKNGQEISNNGPYIDDEFETETFDSSILNSLKIIADAFLINAKLIDFKITTNSKNIDVLTLSRLENNFKQPLTAEEITEWKNGCVKRGFVVRSNYEITIKKISNVTASYLSELGFSRS